MLPAVRLFMLRLDMDYGVPEEFFPNPLERHLAGLYSMVNVGEVRRERPSA